MNRPNNRVPEKSKDFVGSIKRLFKELNSFKILMGILMNGI